MTTLDPDLLLRAYAVGVFPMADSRDAPDVFWVEPKRRGILPLDKFHLSHSLAKPLKSDRFHVTADQAFRSEKHTSELQSLMRISYAVICMKKTNFCCHKKNKMSTKIQY